MIDDDLTEMVSDDIPVRSQRKRIINFSGGQSSALMTIQSYNPDTDYVVFTDTGREHPMTYKFIDDFERNEQIPVIRLGDHNAFSDMLAKRNYRDIPNMMKRSCTRELKIRVARRWARKHIGMAYDNLLGLRYDERRRVVKAKSRWQQVTNVFPLYENRVTKQMVVEYWKGREYRLEIPNILGNCTLCFMKGKNNIINILRHEPDLADPWIDDELRAAESFGHTYLNGITIAECLRISQQPDLFSQIDLDDLNPSYSCNCTS